MITIDLIDGPDFIGSKHEPLWWDYLTETFSEHNAEECEKWVKDHKVFLVQEDENIIGMAVYKTEEKHGIRAILLLELYIKPEYRSIKRLMELKRRIISFFGRRHFTDWGCAVEKEDLRKVHAYQGLGFKPFKTDKNLLILNMKIAGGKQWAA